LRELEIVMAQINVPSFDVVDWKSGLAVAAIAANIALVADTTADRGVKTPANGANNTVTNFKGVAMHAAVAGETISLARTVGDRVVMKANGAITRGATVFLSTADAGKEGFAKSYTNFATDTAVFILGQAETTAADGEYVEVVLAGLYIKTA
jgi:hypothetical protein